MTRKTPRVYIDGRLMDARRYAEAREFNKQASKYIHDRREASRRAKQIREKSGPASMEWVQSALFLYAAKKHGLAKDLRKALWAYTSAMILRLEDYITNTEKIAKQENAMDSFHFIALQLRAAIRNHMKLLQSMKDEVVEVPEVTTEGRRIRGMVHYPNSRDDYESMSYMIGEFREKNPEANDLLPRKDDNI